MTGGILLGSALALGVPAAVLWSHRRRRVRLLDRLAAGPIARDRAPVVFALEGERSSWATEFRLTSLTRIPDALAEDTLCQLREEALANCGREERSYVPMHKQGGTLSYEAIHRHAPWALSTYHAEELRAFLSNLIGVEVSRTPLSDQSSCSLLYYTQPGDHIGWHYDHNFYRGRHFTVLLTVVNRNTSGGVSACRLERESCGREIAIGTEENTLIVFEGARVRHRATPIAAGDLRILLSMTFSTDPRTGPVREIARRIKDTAFYGVRALWD